MTSNFRITPIPALALIASLAVLSGCRGERSRETPRQFFPDLDNQAKPKQQGTTEFYSDGRIMRQPPKGTVPFGRTSFDPAQTRPSATTGPGKEHWGKIYEAKQVELLREDDRIFKGTNPDGTYLASIPVTVDAALLARGEKWFNITCATCHGFAGDAQGMVGKQWAGGAAGVANFHDPKYRDKTVNTGLDGYVFRTAMVGVFDQTGKQKMPGYAHALDAMDAWGVVAYLRVLQETRLGSLSDLSEAERTELLNRKPAPSATPSPTPPVTPPITPPITPPAAPAGGSK